MLNALWVAPALFKGLTTVRLYTRKGRLESAPSHRRCGSRPTVGLTLVSRLPWLSSTFLREYCYRGSPSKPLSRVGG
ncbi:hypothetical protein BD414DRAFT_496847 [Trametes punicea]|nr:hypothetical protein BD414DRAFT_496847 [Trametes punicea]